MTISKRLGAWLLTLALLVGAMPDRGLPAARAADVEEPTTLPFDASSVGAYLPVTVGKGALTATVMNAAAVSEDVATYTEKSITNQIKVNASKEESADRLQDVKFAEGFDSSQWPKNVDDYNMWRNFGVMDNGTVKTVPTAGFSTDNAGYVNFLTPDGDEGAKEYYEKFMETYGGAG